MRKLTAKDTKDAKYRKENPFAPFAVNVKQLSNRTEEQKNN